MNIEKMFTTIDTHVAGEAFRIVVQSSIPLHASSIPLHASSIQLNDEALRMNFQYERNFLLNEPRGHRGMTGCIIVPSQVADYGLLQFHHDDAIQFKYGALIASVTALLETGNLKRKADDCYQIETVYGVFKVEVQHALGEVTAVYLESHSCKTITKTLEYTIVQIDKSRNYAVFPLPESIAEINLCDLPDITKWRKEIVKRLASEAVAGVIMTDAFGKKTNDVRSITFEPGGSILRSPGVDSTMAIFTTLLDQGRTLEELTNSSIFDSAITAKLLQTDNMRFSIETEAFVTGMHQFLYDETDPLKDGFLLK